jgi:hypothetical protein
MERRSFFKSGMFAAAAIGTAPALMSWIPQHNWEGYDFGPGPEVKDRLYQGPFPVYSPENFFSGSNTVQYTTSGNQLINCYGMGLTTYISGDHGAPAIPPGKTLDEVIDGLASFSPSTKLYIRPCWKTLQKKRGRLDFDDYVKITLEKAAKYNKRIGFRYNISVPQQMPRDPNVPVDYTLFMPDYVLEKVPLNKIEGSYVGRNDHAFPEYHNPYFLEFFEEFNALLAEQWNGSDLIEWMDTFMFGWWGEGHAYSLRGNNFPSNTVAEETWIRLFEIQQKYWTKVPLATNTQPDCNQVGNSEVVDRTIRSHNWLRTDSIMIENEQIEAITNRPPWIAAIQEGWISYNGNPDENGFPPNWNVFNKSKDVGANYMNVAIHNSKDNSLENLNLYHNRYPEVLNGLSQTIGFRIRPSWIWRYRADTNRDGLIFGMVNDGIACVPGVLRLTLFNERNPCLVTGCLDAGYPMTRGVRQAAMVLPEGVAWDSGVKLKAELEVKGVKYPIPFAIAQKLNPDGSLTLANTTARRN